MNSNNLDICEQLVMEAVNNRDYGLALDTVAKFVGSVTSNPRSVGKVFSNPKLDGLCELIGEKIAELSSDLRSQTQSSGSVILITQLVATGGHIELIKDYIRLGVLTEPITVLVTEYYAHSEIGSINAFLSTLSKDISLVIAKEVSTNNKISFLLSYLINHPPKDLIIIASNHDSLAISLAGIINSKVMFIHHGDHHLCLGVHSENFIHIDPHNLGYFNCRHDLGVKDNRYWPLVITPVEPIPRTKNHRTTDNSIGLITCTSGRYEKFLLNGYKYDYFHLIPKILSATSGIHFHVGELPLDKLEGIQFELINLGINPDRFIHISFVNSLAAFFIENCIDLYISSFPHGGGKASLEAMSVGVPLLMHENYRSNFFSGIALVYPEAFSWSDEPSLLGILTEICSEKLAIHAGKAKLFFEKYYSDEAFLKLVKLDKEVDLHHMIPKIKKSGENALLNFLEDEKIYNDYSSQKIELNSIININKSLNQDLIELSSKVNELNRFKQNIADSRVWKLYSLFNRLKVKLGILLE